MIPRATALSASAAESYNEDCAHKGRQLVQSRRLGKRLKSVTGRGEGATKNWDAHLWDIR